MMKEDRFWQFIATARDRVDRRKATDGDQFLKRQSEELTRILRELAPKEIAAFEWRFSDLLRRAYLWDLWGAAYWLCGGCSDDGFTDFRSCLVSLGRELYAQVLADPDSLAEIVDRPDVPYLQIEGFQYIAWKLYREKTGEDVPPDPKADRSGPREPAGERCDFEDEDVMAERYPRLVAKYPDMGD
jgi:hypothetical protein